MRDVNTGDRDTTPAAPAPVPPPPAVVQQVADLLAFARLVARWRNAQALFALTSADEPLAVCGELVVLVDERLRRLVPGYRVDVDAAPAPTAPPPPPPPVPPDPDAVQELVDTADWLDRQADVVERLGARGRTGEVLDRDAVAQAARLRGRAVVLRTVVQQLTPAEGGDR